MREDLIERLRECCRNVDGDEMAHHAEPWGADVGLLLEAADALEAAREDAERYRWLRQDAGCSGWAMPRQPIPCPDRIAGCMVAHSGPELSGATLDAAIDQARGKGVAG